MNTIPEIPKVEPISTPKTPSGINGNVYT